MVVTVTTSGWNEIREHRFQRMRKDVHWAGERMIGRDDHNQAQRDENGENAGHANLSP